MTSNFKVLLFVLIPLDFNTIKQSLFQWDSKNSACNIRIVENMKIHFTCFTVTKYYNWHESFKQRLNCIRFVIYCVIKKKNICPRLNLLGNIWYKSAFSNCKNCQCTVSYRSVQLILLFFWRVTRIFSVPPKVNHKYIKWRLRKCWNIFELLLFYQFFLYQCIVRPQV